MCMAVPFIGGKGKMHPSTTGVEGAVGKLHTGTAGVGGGGRKLHTGPAGEVGVHRGSAILYDFIYDLM